MYSSDRFRLSFLALIIFSKVWFCSEAWKSEKCSSRINSKTWWGQSTEGREREGDGGFGLSTLAGCGPGTSGRRMMGWGQEELGRGSKGQGAGFARLLLYLILEVVEE